MFNKLRKKLVIINMLLLTTVFIAIFGTIYITNALSLKKDIKFTLESLINPEPPEGNPQHKPKPLMPNSNNYIIIDLDENNNILNYFTPTQVNKDSLDDLYKAILSNKNNHDSININSRHYSYLIRNIHLGSRLVILDTTPQDLMLSNLLRTFFIIGVLSLGLLLIISILLTNRTLKPVEESFRKQKQFIADASHELRTPLTIIKTNISLVLSNKDNTIKEQSKWLNYINLQSDRMSSLIDEMLTLAKLDSVKEKIIFPKINVSSILNHLLLTFEALIYEKDLKLDSEISKDLFIYGDSKNIQKLFSILLDNAIKNTPGKGTITVSLIRKNNQVIINFTNTGNGIPPEHIDKIFERFYRVDSSRNSSTDGYGLGLSIAKSIVESHKGKIYATSEFGSHCSFIIELPESKMT